MEDLIAAVGKPLQDAAVQSVVSHYRLTPIEVGSNYYDNRQAGIELSTDQGVVKAIVLYSDGHKGHSEFRRPLPRQLTFAHTRETARMIFGEPEAPSDSASPYGLWDRWVMPGYLLHAKYSLVNGQIEEVTLMPSDYASPKVAADVDDGEANVRESSDRKPARGISPSVIIEAWMDELAKTQPQYGRLLQSTVDTVGHLPATDRYGHIYTDINENYVAAAAYAKAYAKVRVDGRRAFAVLAEETAEKAKDVQTKAQKAAEDVFWHGVESWIEAVGVARIKPTPLPEWLASLNVKWN